jgi:hypothetical protein
MASTIIASMWPSTLMTEELRFSETTVKIYHTTRRHTSDNRNLRVTGYLKPGQPEHHAVVLHF